MLLSDARSHIRRAIGKTSNSNAYGEPDLDRAFQGVLDEFFLEVRPVISTGTVFLGGATAPGSRGTVDIATSITNFRPERSVRFELRKFTQSVHQPWTEIEHVDYRTVQNIVSSGTVVGTTSPPTMIAFRDENTAFFDSATGTTWPDLRVTYYDKPTSWVPGESGTVVVNIPSEYATIPLWYGVSSLLQHNDPQGQRQDESYRRYRDWVQRVKGKVTMDSGIIVKDEDAYI